MTFRDEKSSIMKHTTLACDARHVGLLVGAVNLVRPGRDGTMRTTALALSAGSLIVIACALPPGPARAQTDAAPPSAEAVAAPIGKVVSAKGSVAVHHVN